MNWHSTNLKQPEYPHLAKQRRDRLKKMLDINAPEVIVIMMAEQYLRSYKISWRYLWAWIKLNKFPRWLLWLSDADFRAVCREPDDDLEGFEEEMQAMLNPKKKEEQ